MSYRYRLKTVEGTLKKVKTLMGKLGVDNSLERLLDQEAVINILQNLQNVKISYKQSLLHAYLRFLRYAGEKPTPQLFELLKTLDRLRERRLPRIPSWTTALTVLAGIKSWKAKTAYALCLFAGLRPGEAVTLRWTQVDLNERKIILEESEKKSEGSILPIDDNLMFYLKLAQEKKKNELVCGGTTEDNLKQAIIRARKKIAMDDAYLVCAKNLRHIFASRLYKLTRDLVYVQRYLRHKSILTTQRYVHLNIDSQAYDVVKVNISDHKTIQELLERGFTLAVQTKNYLFFKRPKGI